MLTRLSSVGQYVNTKGFEVSRSFLCLRLACDKLIKYTFYAFLPLVFVMFSIFILFTYIMFLNFRYNKENEVKDVNNDSEELIKS